MAAGLQLLLEVDDKGTPKVSKFEGRWEKMKRRVIGGTNAISRSWMKAKTAWGGLQRHIQRGAKILGLALAGLVTATVIVGAKFEQAMAKVSSVAGGTAADLRRLTATARKWGESTAFSASQVADAMYSLASAGQTTGQIIKSTGGVLLFAGAAATSMGKAAELVTKTLGAFGLKASATGRIVNVYAAAIAGSMLNADRLSESMKNVAGVAGQLGLSIEETTATIGLMVSAGMEASMAGTGLRGMLSRLLKPSEELKTVLGGVTVQTHGLAAVIKKLEAADPTVLARMFDTEQLNAAMTLVGIGSERIKEFTKEITGTTKAQELYNKQQDTLIGDLKRFKSAVEENMIAVFEKIKPMLRTVLGDMITKVKELKPLVVGIGEGFATAFSVIYSQYFKPFLKNVSEAEINIGTLSVRIELFALEAVQHIGKVVSKIEDIIDAIGRVGDAFTYLPRKAEEFDKSVKKGFAPTKKVLEDVDAAIRGLFHISKEEGEFVGPPISLQWGDGIIRGVENTTSEVQKRIAVLRDIISGEFVGPMQPREGLGAEPTTPAAPAADIVPAIISPIIRKGAEERIQLAGDVADAEIISQDAVLANWIANHETEMMYLETLGTAYDTLYDSILSRSASTQTGIIDHEKTGKQRREQIWKAMKMSFFKNTAAMIKYHITNWLKGLIVTEAAQSAANKRARVGDAKAGAVKAYSAFAAIPIVGPALGAAAAAAAFAFLMAFHKGGLIGENARREFPVLVEGGEHVTQRRSVTPATRPVLEYINKTGTVPATGGGDVYQIEINVDASGGGQADIGAIMGEIEEELVPILEDLNDRRRFSIKTRGAA